MTVPLGNYLGNLWLEWLHEQGAWLAAHQSDPTVLGLLSSEVAGAGYLRQRLLFGLPSNKTIASANAWRFVGMPACRLTYLAAWDAPANGNYLFPIRLASPIDVPVNGQLLGAIGDVAFQL